MSQDNAHNYAERFLNGENLDNSRLFEIIRELKNGEKFGLGLRVFEKLSEKDSSIPIPVAQDAVLCAYKDPDVPVRDGLDRAVKILNRFCKLDESEDPETLGLAGAVYKRMWERTGKRSELNRSAHYYRLSFMGRTENEPEIQRNRIREDQGYNAINAAFLADVVASTAEAGGEAQRAKKLRDQADLIRDLIGEVLDEQPLSEVDERKRYWFLATKLEAAFGRGDFERAEKELKQILNLPELQEANGIRKNSWMLKSTVTQLAKLIRYRFPDTSYEKPRQILRTLLGDQTTRAVIDSLIIGKVGLSLSGGGFRAAFFHIGVLARLAELDVLRHVEVVSTVSGGSIVGAQYYLLLKRELEKSNELDRQGYIKIVHEMEEQFFQAVQIDVRSTLYSGLSLKLAKLLRPRTAVSKRLGSMFEEYFYQPFFGSADKTDRIYMDQMQIHPGGNRSFRMKHDNWHRHSKVPALIVNATSLNTGHVWQFTTTYAGESPYAINDYVDSNDRLRRFYYRPSNAPDKAPVPQRRIELGTAVAASACVPGLFPPVDLGERYEGYKVQLVDGGVHDNQGVISLLEQDCTQLIVSDACGQMTTNTAPTGVAAAPLLRSNSILMERVRQEEYERITTLRETARLGGILFVHLRQDLAGEAVSWIDCEDPRRLPTREELLSYGIRREYQEALAGIRTDLDAFSEVEAYALMFSGYRMVDRGFANALPDLNQLSQPQAKCKTWKFLAVKELMTEHPPLDARHNRFRSLLKEGSKPFSRDSDEEETKTISYLMGSVRRVKFIAISWVAVLVIVSLLAGVVFGLPAAMWTAVGMLTVSIAAAAITIVIVRDKLQKDLSSSQLDGLSHSIPAICYAVVLRTMRLFSIFHLKHYKDQLLARGTIASLNNTEPSPD